jgi:hypothetical protein
MGTLNLGQDILRTSWILGAYMDEKNLRCSSYYTYLAQYLLNNIAILNPLLISYSLPLIRGGWGLVKKYESCKNCYKYFILSLDE